MADLPLSVPKAAELVGVSPPTLYRWIERGEVQSERSPGGRKRVRESEALRVRAWLSGEDWPPRPLGDKPPSDSAYR